MCLTALFLRPLTLEPKGSECICLLTAEQNGIGALLNWQRMGLHLAAWDTPAGMHETKKKVRASIWRVSGRMNGRAVGPTSVVLEGAPAPCASCPPQPLCQRAGGLAQHACYASGGSFRTNDAGLSCWQSTE